MFQEEGLYNRVGEEEGGKEKAKLRSEDTRAFEKGGEIQLGLGLMRARGREEEKS